VKRYHSISGSSGLKNVSIMRLELKGRSRLRSKQSCKQKLRPLYWLRLVREVLPEKRVDRDKDSLEGSKIIYLESRHHQLNLHKRTVIAKTHRLIISCLLKNLRFFHPL